MKPSAYFVNGIASKKRRRRNDDKFKPKDKKISPRTVFQRARVSSYISVRRRHDNNGRDEIQISRADVLYTTSTYAVPVLPAYGETGGGAVDMNIYKFVNRNMNKRPYDSYRCSRKIIAAYCDKRETCGDCSYGRLLCPEFTPLYNCVTRGDAKRWDESYESR